MSRYSTICVSGVHVNRMFTATH